MAVEGQACVGVTWSADKSRVSRKAPEKSNGSGEQTLTPKADDRPASSSDVHTSSDALMWQGKSVGYPLRTQRSTRDTHPELKASNGISFLMSSSPLEPPVTSSRVAQRIATLAAPYPMRAYHSVLFVSAKLLLLLVPSLILTHTKRYIETQ